jgi:hydroxylamine reductase (hybrid-cluster protein)
VDKLADKKISAKHTHEAAPHVDKKPFTVNSFTQEIAAGTEFYSGLARKTTQALITAGKGQKSGTVIKDEWKLQQIAAELGIQTGGRDKNAIAVELGELLLNEFNKQEGELLFLKRAPSKRLEIWHKQEITPSGIEKEISATKNSAGADGQNPLSQGAKCALANGWGSDMIAAEIQDILSGTPAPTLQGEGKTAMVTGFSPEAIIYTLGGSFRGSLRPLIDNIINGRIRGIAGMFNCGKDAAQVALVKELIKNDVLVLFTGDDAADLAAAGLLVYEGGQLAGEGLHSVCEAVGLPPVLHMGASVDNCRILIAASALVKEGKLGDVSDLPACIAVPSVMNEKAMAVGQCFVSSGFYTMSGNSQLVGLTGEMEKLYGGMWDFANDPSQAAQKMIARIDLKRKALGIDKSRERVLYDMAMRRELM